MTISIKLGEELLNKSLFLFFFAHKKYSHTFVKIEPVTLLSKVRKLGFNQINSLICIPRMNGGLTDLEQHEGK